MKTQLVVDRNILIPSQHHKPIVADYFYKPTQIPKPVVIFCHGYKGFKDWGAWDLVAKAFAEADLFFVKFNFSHNGTTPDNPTEFTDLEAFGQNNYSIELDDLQTVIDQVQDRDFAYAKEIATNSITIIGHSRGGGIVTIKAAEVSAVTKLVTWAGVANYDERFIKGEALEKWKEDGVYYIMNGRTKQQMPHYYQFYVDYLENKERFSIERSVKNLQIPHLIVHGTSDPTVEYRDAERLHRWNPKSILEPVEGADHVFGARHPWDKSLLPKDLEQATQRTIAFIKNS